MAEISKETMKELRERVAELNGHMAWLENDILENPEGIDNTLDALEMDYGFIAETVEKARNDLREEDASA